MRHLHDDFSPFPVDRFRHVSKSRDQVVFVHSELPRSRLSVRSDIGMTRDDQTHSAAGEGRLEVQ